MRTKQINVKFNIDILSAFIDAINSLSGHDLADLRIPEYEQGEALCTSQGSACIILEVHPTASSGIEYTILWEGEVHHHVSESALFNWDIIGEDIPKPTMLSS